MKVNLKKLVGSIAVAGALGLPAFVAGAGAANAATPAPSIPSSLRTVPMPADLGATQVRPVDWNGDWNDWGHRRGWDRDWRGHGDWGHGGWGRGGWGWRW
jgi:hypothetical protein